MLLADYLTAKGETQTAFALRAGLSDSTLSRVLRGETAPTAAIVDKVEAATDVGVTANDLFAAYRAARRGRDTAAAPVEAVP